MVVLTTIILAFIINISFMVLESRRTIYRQGKFWIMLISLGLVLGTVIYGAA